jgi:hypothetical protein
MQASSLSGIVGFIENGHTLGSSSITTKAVRYQSTSVCYAWPARYISMSLAREELYSRSSNITAFPQKFKRKGRGSTRRKPAQCRFVNHKSHMT